MLLGAERLLKNTATLVVQNLYIFTEQLQHEQLTVQVSPLFLCQNITKLPSFSQVYSNIGNSIPLKCMVLYRLLIINSSGGSDLRERNTPVILSRGLRQHGRAERQILCSCLQPYPLSKPENIDGQIGLLATHWTYRIQRMQQNQKLTSKPLAFIVFTSKADINMKYFVNFHCKSAFGTSS